MPVKTQMREGTAEQSADKVFIKRLEIFYLFPKKFTLKRKRIQMVYFFYMERRT